MNPKVLGIALSDISTNLIFYPDDEALIFPTVISKKKGEDAWVVGEDAYALALDGKGIITDKLLKLTRKDGIATIDGTRYEGKEILKIYFREIINAGMEKLYKEKPEEVVVAMAGLEEEIVGDIREAFVGLGYQPNHIHIISKEESFIYFVLSLKKDIWNNKVGMYDLSDVSLTYYEMLVNRNSRKLLVNAESENMDEAFNLQILNNPSGAKLADKILTSVAEKVMDKKKFSSIFLTGQVFAEHEWADGFISYLCSRGKVYLDTNIFAKGAAFKGVDLASENSIYNLTALCEGRLRSDVFINVENNGKDGKIYLAKAGDFWGEPDTELLMIPDEKEVIDISVVGVDGKVKKNIPIVLDFLPKRPIKTRRFYFRTKFRDDKIMDVEIEDAGFGDMYPPTDVKRNIEVNIWD
ncbi:hypothetical protein LSA36186_04000 [Lachnoanaerobaculum sp. JCM 36186]|uniref:DUF5716 family protein n=1 Tax=Lachnoanaerobaculum sanguinis TaxID=3065809 RepID=UPI002759D392|nr:DUF5716 family protein [Lachnoanaerobaculum sp. JCM 36186]GMO02151.1 hypothetical protein LSA36186_04000 [Lachnoanaerobaculum sp. JCM 36186]